MVWVVVCLSDLLLQDGLDVLDDRGIDVRHCLLGSDVSYLALLLIILYHRTRLNTPHTHRDTEAQLSGLGASRG